jgi:hypothetical protein
MPKLSNISKKYVLVGSIILIAFFAIGFIYLTSAKRNSTTSEGMPNSYLITYTNDGFSPLSAKIGIPGRITFINESSKSFWPTLQNQSSTLPCVKNNQIEPCEPIRPGDFWSGSLQAAGDWYFYDKLNPTKTFHATAILIPSP